MYHCLRHNSSCCVCASFRFHKPQTSFFKVAETGGTPGNLMSTFPLLLFYDGPPSIKYFLK